MPIEIDWPEIYSDVISGKRTKRGIAAARLLERDIRLAGWAVGRVFADRGSLSRRYGFGRGTLVEAVRLLEDRGVARMRRGPGGGLVVLEVPRVRALEALGSYAASTGISPDQIAEARLLVRIMRNYVQASAESPLALEAFEDVIRRGLRDQGSNALTAIDALLPPARERSDDPVLAFFSECIDYLSRKLPAPAGSDANTARSGSNDRLAPKASLASVIAKRLAREIQQEGGSDLERLGTEAELGDRFGVSRHVVRQAVRILEAQGSAQSRRGRTHGLASTALDSTAAVEAIVALLSSMCVSEPNIRAASAVIGRLTRILVIAKSTAEDFAEFDRLVARGHTWGGTDMFSQWIRLDWQIIDNPLSCIFAQALTGYRVRLRKDTCVAPVEGIPEVQAALREHSEAARRRDFVAADEAYQRLMARVRASLYPD